MQTKENKTVKYLKEIIPYIAIIIIVVLIRTFFITPIRVNGNSMDPTLIEGETMLLNKISLKKGIDRYDIVVVDTPSDYIIKRVLALPNETIACIDGDIYINGQKIKDYAKSEMIDFTAVTLGSDEYFVMGDNRRISKDSRIIGPVKKSQIKGKAHFVLFPFTKFGTVDE